MIITRTPYRISFFGGGTDYPSWYEKNGGATLCTTIDKYCYISCRILPPFFEHKFRIVYSKIELCRSATEIQHPSVRAALQFLGFDRGLEIHHDGDLPARSGIGSSSSFTVGLLHALYGLQGILPGKRRLALESIHIEQKIIQEMVGSQDQIIAAVGGLNHISFRCDGQTDIQPVTLSCGRREELNSHLMLFYTGIKRTASNIANGYARSMDRKSEALNEMHRMVGEGIEILHSGRSIEEFGELLHRGWLLKKSLSSMVSNGIINDIYERAQDAGAIGGKILGAGGGGFLLLFVPPELQKQVRHALGNLIHVPFRFETDGSQVVFYEPQQQDYSELELDRATRKVDSFQELQSISNREIVEIRTPARNTEDQVESSL